MKDTITPLNYTKEAIKDLSVMEKGLRSNAPLTSYIMRQVIDMLDSSVKFILPNCCDIIEPEEYRQTHFDLARLPYPVVTFEIPWFKDNVETQIGDFNISPSSRRIALCWEARQSFEPIPGCNSILNTYIDGGVFILPVSWSDDLKIWILGVGGMFFPYNNKLTKYEPDRTLPASRLVIDTLKENGVAKYNAAHFKAEPFITSMEFKDDLIKQVGSIERLYAQIIMDTRDELQAFIQACSVLNCENVCPVTLSTKPERKFINGRKVQPPEKNKRTAKAKLVILSVSLTPGALSTPLEVSTSGAPVRAIASATFVGFSPPASPHGKAPRYPASSDQSNANPMPPGSAPLGVLASNKIKSAAPA
uniref:Uncharacterized protein n=7 Tax=Escherichia TaxID=561 RepID=A0A7L7TFX6_ECOLX|nr:hypothetical protein [Escherichia coli]